ncbi:MAG: hypothetical protein KM310_11590 [Clostridiales bacterium]|nr:hypothetical protein [Clostridiales bacterium]
MGYLSMGCGTVPVFERAKKAWVSDDWDEPPVSELRVYNAYGNSYRVVDFQLEAPLPPGQRTWVVFFYDVPARYANEKLVWWDRPASGEQWFAAKRGRKLDFQGPPTASVTAWPVAEEDKTSMIFWGDRPSGKGAGNTFPTQKSSLCHHAPEG